jgi:hypothetical protein
MSTSPPKEPEVEHSTHSGEEQGDMDREQEGAPGTGVGDFEVKEQDRWLPIANGGWTFLSLSSWVSSRHGATTAENRRPVVVVVWNLICSTLA